MRTPKGHLDRSAFERYLDVVNRAIAESRRQFPYQAILQALHERLACRPFLVTIAGEHVMDHTPIGCLLDAYGYVWLPTVPTAPATRWTLHRDHVHDVLAEPWMYLANPRRLELPPFSLLAPHRVFSGSNPTRPLSGRAR